MHEKSIHRDRDESTPPTSRVHRVIRADRPWHDLGLREAWLHRELLWVFTSRNIAVRYRQMALGFSWSFFEPLALLLTLAIVFGAFLRVPTDGYPYPVFVFAALVPWMLFNKATTNASGALQENMTLISKIYFPRILLPLSAVLRDLWDAAIVVLILVAMSWLYGFPPSLRMLVLPFLLAYVLFFALGIALWTAGMLVRLRDLRPMIAIAMQLGFYATPILFGPNIVPERFLAIVQLNPMYWPIDISRWIFLAKPLEFTASFWISAAVVVLVFVSGLFVFARSERFTVDVQ